MRALEREHIRPVLESEIERLINALDLLDGDTDLEDGDDARMSPKTKALNATTRASLMGTRKLRVVGERSAKLAPS